jgi:predicted metal-dependent HD superfamily phosphohydrolase
MSFLGTPPRGLSIPQELWARVREAYATPGRAYHGPAHVASVLRGYEEVAREHGWIHPAEVFLALLFHDAIYWAGAADNEEKSAAFAQREIERWLPPRTVDPELVGRLIQLTAHHGSLERRAVTQEEALFLDCDMTILGASPQEFEAYDRQIAEEYAALRAEAYERGRREFLQRLLERQHIFLSEFFEQRLDAAARANLRHRLGD